MRAGAILVEGLSRLLFLLFLFFFSSFLLSSLPRSSMSVAFSECPAVLFWNYLLCWFLARFLIAANLSVGLENSRKVFLSFAGRRDCRGGDIVSKPGEEPRRNEDGFWEGLIGNWGQSKKASPRSVVWVCFV